MSAGESIDRIAPTRRPEGVRMAQRQRWETLLFLHWRVPVEALRPLIPAELEIDTFDGSAWVGLVPFTMKGVRLSWLPAVPGTSDFHETNVRTYVHYKGRDPGVWFFSLDAAAWLPAKVARTFWHLPYFHADMTLAEADGEVSYATRRLSPQPAPAVAKVRYRPEGEDFHATPGTLEHFLAERYILYAQTRAGLQVGRVHHPPYPLRKATVFSWEEDLLKAAGIARGGEAPMALWSPGVSVEVYALTDLAR